MKLATVKLLIATATGMPFLRQLERQLRVTLKLCCGLITSVGKQILNGWFAAPTRELKDWRIVQTTFASIPTEAKAKQQGNEKLSLSSKDDGENKDR